MLHTENSPIILQLLWQIPGYTSLNAMTPGANPLSPTEKNKLHNSKHLDTENQVYTPPGPGSWCYKCMHLQICSLSSLKKKISWAFCGPVRVSVIFLTQH